MKTRHRTRDTISLLLLLISVVFSVSPANAASLRIFWPDPVGDSNTVQFDASGAELLFDNNSGAFELTIFADPGSPFSGNLNVSWGVDNASISCCQDVIHGFFERRNLAPTTELKISGVWSSLTYWNVGDQVDRSSVRLTFVDALDFSGADGIFRRDGDPYFVLAAPLPPAVYLFVGAIAFLRVFQVYRN